MDPTATSSSQSTPIVSIESGEAVINLREPRTPMLDHTEQKRAARLLSENPFTDPPRGFEFGLQINALQEFVEALDSGKSIVVSGPHGSGRGPLVSYTYGHCIEHQDAAIATNPIPWSLADVAGPEVREVIHALKAAAFSAISNTQEPSTDDSLAQDGPEKYLPSPRRIALDGLQRVYVGVTNERAERSADDLMKVLTDFAHATGNSLVLTLRDAENLGRKQLALLGRVLARFSAAAVPVQWLVSGLPSAAADLRVECGPECGVVEIALEPHVSELDHDAAVQYILDLSAHSRIPFTRAAAVALLEDADGMKALINMIGERAWDLTAERNDEEVTQFDVRIASAAVQAEMAAKYAEALNLVKRGDVSAVYVHALHLLTVETGELLHSNDAVLARAGLTLEQGAHVHREYLREHGYTMRTSDGRVGLADPQLGLQIERLVPGALRDLR